jgi:lipoprotein-releasing system ATP-binding protein
MNNSGVNQLVPVIKCTGLMHRYTRGVAPVEVLRGIDFTLEAGEMVGLVGQSGSGKSTFLQLLGLLDTPTSGKISILGNVTSDANEQHRTNLRGRYIGFVYQFHHLLPELTALENVMMPLRIAGKSRAESLERAKSLLVRLGLEHRLTHYPAQMSGGEQQRTAIARALANAPRLLLADEPTGNLDTNTANEVCEWLLSLARDEGVAAIIATHNPALAKRLSRVVRMDQGLLVNE